MSSTALIVCDTTAPGGVDRYVRALATVAREKQWRVHVLLDDHHEADSLARDLSAGKIGLSRGTLHKRHAEDQRRAAVLKTLASTEPHVMHVVLPVPWAGVAPREIAVERGIRLVATEQLVDASFTLESSLRDRIEKCYRHSVCHIAVSRANKKVLTERFHLPADKILVVPNSVDTSYWRLPSETERTDARRELGVDLPAILCLARLDHQKAIDVLLQACAQPGMPALPWVLLVAGTGPDESTLRKLAGQLNIADRIHWLGWRDDVRRLLFAADLFVLPSRYEGQPISLLDAMATGVPVVATEVSGTPEALDRGRLGRLTPPEDPAALAEAIAAVLQQGADPEQTQRARQAIETNHDQTKNLKQTIDLWSA